jgi:hypothetical protein
MFSSLSRYFHQWAIKSQLLDPENLENVNVVVSLDIHQDVVPVKKPRIEVYWSLFRLRLHKFSRPEYRRERFLR